jgi:hypothetical protein
MPHQRRIHFSGLPLIRQGELRGLIQIIENLKCVSDRFWGRLPLGSLYERFPVASHGAYQPLVKEVAQGMPLETGRIFPGEKNPLDLIP